MKHFFVFITCSGLVLALSGFGEPTRAALPEPTLPDAPRCDAVWYADADADGFGAVAEAVLACDPPRGFATLPGDCDNSRPDVNPAAAETCNGRDDDCDGRVDDAVPLWFRDGDGDGWGDAANTWSRCDRPDGYASKGGDCDDRDGTRFPGSGCPR